MPIDRWFCRREVEKLRNGPICTPPSLEGTCRCRPRAVRTGWCVIRRQPDRQYRALRHGHQACAPHRESQVAAEDIYNADVRDGFPIPQHGVPYEACAFCPRRSAPAARCRLGGDSRPSISRMARSAGRCRSVGAQAGADLAAGAPKLGTPHAGGAIATGGGPVHRCIARRHVPRSTSIPGSRLGARAAGGQRSR